MEKERVQRIAFSDSQLDLLIELVKLGLDNLKREPTIEDALLISKLIIWTGDTSKEPTKQLSYTDITLGSLRRKKNE